MNNLRHNHDIVKDIGLTLLSEGKTIRIKAHGYSMYPCIKPGSLILIEPLNIKGMPCPGEIVAVKREAGLIVHRLSDDHILLNRETRLDIGDDIRLPGGKVRDTNQEWDEIKNLPNVIDDPVRTPRF